MTTDLLLTLGHNSSAVVLTADEGHAHVLNGYELERLTGVKSDSRFPLDAVMAIKERGAPIPDRVYVTHWDPGNRVDGMKSKYWERSMFPDTVPIISQENVGLTHHDCHAYAALAFAGEEFPNDDTGVLVIDGFGSFSEHLSFYRLNEGRVPILFRRFFGYGTSLGLMYQYTTAFLGMKMHEDEYKLLGYGAHVGEIDIPIKRLRDVIMRETALLTKLMRNIDGSRLNIGLDALPPVQATWAEKWAKILDEIGMVGVDRTSYEARVVVGYMVQGILESTIATLFGHDLRRVRHLIVTGGVAFNVEMNRKLLGIVPGKLCVMPIAGDQGNSLGLWAFHNRRMKLHFGDLCWGVRSTESFGGTVPTGLSLHMEDCDAVYEEMAEALRTTGFVNLVRGRMEYGPRALCNTSTIALANRPDVVDEINRINGRDTVMPFAPVVHESLASDFFPDIGRLHLSDQFMICALKYRSGIGEAWPGAALHTATGDWTGRPQVYRPRLGKVDSLERLLRENGGILINTSFNVHGVPICLDLKDVVHSHEFQHQRNPNVRTIVITEGSA